METEAIRMQCLALAVKLMDSGLTPEKDVTKLAASLEAYVISGHRDNDAN